MDFYTWNQKFSNLGSNRNDRSLGNSDGFSRDCGNADGVFTKSSQSLVLNEQKGELVKADGKVIGKKIGLKSDEKAMAALKSHSDAERRRRERINAHLHTFRGLVPCTDKMDKATLLAEVIRHVKQLKTDAKEASIGLLIPEDVDELIIEKVNGGLTFRASICCKRRPELLTDLRRALDALKVNIERAELSALGDHMKIVFYFTRTTTATTDEDLVSFVREALNSVIEKAPFSPEYSPRTTLPNKRRRYSL
ncbi:transcription factor bHLH30-like [Cynara cardunculus var. scolymus]|uniref:Myc-type, basic helix-loop-helix (BHLH) domain-containing protein n=1 Tax=Cynara cardunculus var. scolymus TaxID=59895 RepID=A0A103XTU1_CYNCS|nr:transcription factor bHLH30-like [Cynara cardunculus var. scolymus]KVH96782.1 Myc-type, basic helix-loop-helix (bHLH) domain-containing protein [Cynara cardunculus var. scolymus]